MDSDFPARSKTGRAYISDLRRRGLFVKVTGLHLEDTGVYWVGIDKINADIMTQVKVVVTEGENTLTLTLKLLNRTSSYYYVLQSENNN